MLHYFEGPKLAKITSRITSIEEGASRSSYKNTGTRTTIDLSPSPIPVKEPAPQRRPVISMPKPSFRWITIVTLLLLIAWLAIAAIISISLLDISANYKSYSALQWTSIAGLFIAPLLIIGITAYAFKQLSSLSSQAYLLNFAANALGQPDANIIAKSETMAGAIAVHVDMVNDKLNAALGRLSSLEDVLNSHTGALQQSNIDATKTAGQISNSFQDQRDGLQSIASTFDERMGALSMMITSHTNDLAKATQMAEQKIKEARISVDSATAKINTASDIVRSHTVQATSTLNASHADISSLGNIIKERAKELETVYQRHAGNLTSMIEHLRDEQENLGSTLEERLIKMRDISLSAQASAESLSEASQSGKETVKALAQSASLADGAVKARFKEMRDMVKYSTEHAQSISEKTSQRVKDSLELTRKEISRIERDMAELHDRINDSSPKSLELIPENIIEDPKTPQKRRWTRLKLQPVVDETAQPNKIEPLNANDTNIAIPETANVFSDHSSKKTKPDENETPLDLYIEPLGTPTYQQPTIPDAAASQSISKQPPQTLSHDASGETIHRETPPEIEEQKSGFSFKTLFGRDKTSEPPSSLDIVSSTPPKAIAPTPLKENSPIDSASMLESLILLGLTPDVIVDDGCVILAANSRASRGHDAMSRMVIERLKGPVEHMAKAIAIDTNLSSQTISFATQFDKSVEALSDDREAVRVQLESEDGRAYLLCDAALNFGQV